MILPVRAPFLLALLPLLGLACASGRGEGPMVLEAAGPIQAGEKVQLSLKSTEPVAGEPDWEIQEFHGGALLRSTGWTTTYLAPAVAGTYHVVLTARRPDGTRIRQVEALRVGTVVTLDPPAARLAQGATLQFTARLKGSARGGIHWSSEPEGAVSAAGLFTAPNRPGTYQVVATCAQDPESSATATVVVD